MSTATQEKAAARASKTEAACGKPLVSPQIGLYKNATATKQCADLTIEELIEAIRGDEFKEQITQMRAMLAAGDVGGYSVAKKDLMAVSISASVEGRRAKAAEEGRMTHTGFIQVDLDGGDNIGWTVEEMRDELITDEHIQAVFVTPSGEGVKGLFRISPVPAGVDLVAQHKHAFAQVAKRFEEKNLTIDGACCDPVRLAFVSHDPGAWLREEEAPPMLIDPLPPQTARRQQELPQPPPAKPKVDTDTSQGLIIRSKHGGFPEPPQHGIHTWLMAAAWWCRFHDMTEADAVAKLQSYDGQLRRALQPTEAVDAARAVFSAPLPSPVTVEPPSTKLDPGELRARAYAMRFDPNEVPPPDETCMVIGDIPIAARGNLTVPQGKSKVGKSAVISAVIGAAHRGNISAPGDTLCIEWIGEAAGAIVHLDTEQSRADWHELVCRGITRSGLPETSPRLVSLPLVMFSRSERLAILKEALAFERDAQGGIDLVLIDGVADLCISPNDEAEALELVSQLHALAQEFNCPIVCVLHENPGSDQGKTRGHLGSELNRKAFANLRIDKDSETSISTLYGTDMRKRDIPREQGFCFGWDDASGMHTFQGRAAGLKAAQKETVATSKARADFEPIFEFAAEQRENPAFPALTPKEAAEIEREMSGKDNLTKTDTMKKRMQKAESLGILRKSDLLRWTIIPAGTAGKERENGNNSRP